MIDYVIDTNIVMSMLISGKSHYRTILNYYKFYMPEFSLTELHEYKQVIVDKTKFTKQELNDFIFFVFSSVSVIPTFALSNDSISKALHICENIDVKDVSFLALSYETKFKLLTRDIALYSGLKLRGFRNVMLFKDFINQL